jgi:Na+/proline symporter
VALATFVSFVAPERTIFWFAIFGWSGIAATFCPMVILSLFWPRFTEKAAIASMAAGFLMTMISKFLLQELPGVGPVFVALETMPPSFLAALIVGYVVSIIFPEPDNAMQFERDLLASSQLKK